MGLKEVRIALLGLDAAGKTTLLYKLKLGEIVTTIPTIGFNVETLKFKRTEIIAWDVGGRDKIRPLWRHYLGSADALIFMIDANDRERIGNSKEQLMELLDMFDSSPRIVPVLIYANKQDLPNAMSIAEVSDKLELAEIQKRGYNYYIQRSSVSTGDGIFEGLEWLTKSLSSLQQEEARKNSFFSLFMNKFNELLYYNRY